MSLVFVLAMNKNTGNFTWHSWTRDELQRSNNIFLWISIKFNPKSELPLIQTMAMLKDSKLIFYLEIVFSSSLHWSANHHCCCCHQKPKLGLYCLLNRIYGSVADNFWRIGIVGFEQGPYRQHKLLRYLLIQSVSMNLNWVPRQHKDVALPTDPIRTHSTTLIKTF